jgi:RNA polymerase sigma factor (TIGR02999 family)
VGLQSPDTAGPFLHAHPMAEVTQLLHALAAGEADAADRLYALLYPELRRLARGHLHAVGPISLDPPALIHELWLRTRGAEVATHRAQFFALASRVMRSVLIDHLRKQRADKRGGGAPPLTLNTWALLEAQEDAALDGAGAWDLDRLDDALQQLAQVDERAHRVVEMRFFGGLQHEEIAELLAVSVPTVKRDWRRARAFLFEQLQP